MLIYFRTHKPATQVAIQLLTELSQLSQLGDLYCMGPQVGMYTSWFFQAANTECRRLRNMMSSLESQYSECPEDILL